MIDWQTPIAAVGHNSEGHVYTVSGTSGLYLATWTSTDEERAQLVGIFPTFDAGVRACEEMSTEASVSSQPIPSAEARV